MPEIYECSAADLSDIEATAREEERERIIKLIDKMWSEAIDKGVDLRVVNLIEAIKSA